MGRRPGNEVSEAAGGKCAFLDTAAWFGCLTPALLAGYSPRKYSFSGLFSFLEVIKTSLKPNLFRTSLSASKVYKVFELNGH